MDLKVGDKVRLNLKEEIKKGTKNKKKGRKHESIINLWKALDGRIGTISIIDGDNIWVKGDEHETDRLFNEHVLEKVEE